MDFSALPNNNNPDKFLQLEVKSLAKTSAFLQTWLANFPEEPFPEEQKWHNRVYSQREKKNIHEQPVWQLAPLHPAMIDKTLGKHVTPVTLKSTIKSNPLYDGALANDCSEKRKHNPSWTIQDYDRHSNFSLPYYLKTQFGVIVKASGLKLGDCKFYFHLRHKASWVTLNRGDDKLLLKTLARKPAVFANATKIDAIFEIMMEINSNHQISSKWINGHVALFYTGVIKREVENPNDLQYWMEDIYTPGYDTLLKKKEREGKRSRHCLILLLVLLAGIVVAAVAACIILI